MKNIFITLTVMICAALVWADDGADSAGASTGIAVDIAADSSADIPADTVINTSARTAVIDDDDDDEFDDDDFTLDSLVIDINKRPDIVSREYNHRRQMRLAIVMMVFITIIISTSQSWNPQ